MDSKYFGLIPFSHALALEADAFASVRAGVLPGMILGFESEPVVTCGVRAGHEDLIFGREELGARGFEICKVDRGGQATLHNPGQLVIFPVMNVRAIGARAWVYGLAKVTADCLKDFAIESEWRESQPGLYTSHGKIMACGVRLKSGVSTHGISINVRNNLADFQLIRACGIADAPIAKMGDSILPADVFGKWCVHFRHAFG